MLTKREEIRLLTNDNVLIEGIIETPEEIAPIPMVVLCHPHPQFGGQMNDSVISTISYSLVANGISTLKFNFRGVGKSEGSFDNGDGETLDALAAIKFASDTPWVDKEKISILGYSFGAKIALNAFSHTSGIESLVLIAPPIKNIKKDEAHSLNTPKLLVLGEQDDLIQADDIYEIYRNMADPKRIEIIPNANHFFQNSLPHVARCVTDFFNDLDENHQTADLTSSII